MKGFTTFWRGLSLQGPLLNKEVAATKPQENIPHPPNPSIIEPPRTKPTGLDRIFLTWSGAYKNKADIPSTLPGDVVLRARSFARIRINIGFLIVAAVGGMVVMYIGREGVRRGEGIESMNLEWHRKIKEDYEKSIAKDGKT